MTSPQTVGRRPYRTPVLLAAGIYLAIWIATAISPVDRFDWLLENLLVFALVAALLAGYRRLPLSNASYLCMLAFLSMHAVGAHYTYAATPFGFAVAGLLGFTRNHYDRLAHFAFGLLFVYPLREVLMRTSNLRGARLAFVTVAMLLAFSASYELIEWWVALIVDPHAAYAYLGTQGDVFDAQKDESWALVGACGGVALLSSVARCRARRKPR